VVEHFLGKEEVIGSIPIVGSRFPLCVFWVLIEILNIGGWGDTVAGCKGWVNNYESHHSIGMF
jgi:hypothetical protein